jgi:cell division septum initiation protein DivIVA
MDLDYLIDRLEELLDHSTRVPGTSWVVINEDEYLRLIDQMRISVPQEIKSARQIESERDALLTAAQDQAEAMISAAREKADQLVAEHSVIAQAEERSDEVLADAYRQAAAVRTEADAYALEVLERIAAQLETFGRTNDNGMKVLQEGQASRAAAYDDPSAADRIQPEIVGDDSPASPA